MSEVNEHAEIIANTVYHTFPYNMLIPNFKGPHADDCGGCLINAEVKKLVDKLNELSPVEEIIANLEESNNNLETLRADKSLAFRLADFREDGSISYLVTNLVSERDRLARLLESTKRELNTTIRKL
jgi:hypothetical protein